MRWRAPMAGPSRRSCACRRRAAPPICSWSRAHDRLSRSSRRHGARREAGRAARLSLPSRFAQPACAVGPAARSRTVEADGAVAAGADHRDAGAPAVRAIGARRRRVAREFERRGRTWRGGASGCPRDRRAGAFAAGAGARAERAARIAGRGAAAASARRSGRRGSTARPAYRAPSSSSRARSRRPIRRRRRRRQRSALLPPSRLVRARCRPRRSARRSSRPARARDARTAAGHPRHHRPDRCARAALAQAGRRAAARATATDASRLPTICASSGRAGDELAARHRRRQRGAAQPARQRPRRSRRGDGQHRQRQRRGAGHDRPRQRRRAAAAQPVPASGDAQSAAGAMPACRRAARSTASG